MATKPLDAVGVPADVRCDVRLEQLRGWLNGTFGTEDYAIAPASSDASFRRYFRVTRLNQTWIAMDAPPARENLAAYLRVAEMLTVLGVHVPRVVRSEPSAGFLLLTDLGTRTYYDELRQGADAERLYADALAALACIQARGHEYAAQLPVYEAGVLQREAALFTDWFCLRHLQLALSAAQVRMLHEANVWLAQQAFAQPRVFVHRDFHSRNLMVCEPQVFPNNPGILDFQDALQGPLTYDLVSLLRDCYLDWPQAQVTQWLRRFHGELSYAGASNLALEQLHHWFDSMGVQRHLKAIGIFARLWHRDGKRAYLEHIPRTLRYVCSVAARYRELAALGELIEEHVLPAWTISASSSDPSSGVIE